MFNQLFTFITCGFCEGKLQALKQVADPSDETGEIMLVVNNEEQLNAIAENHWATCTKETPYLDDSNAFYEK